GLSRNASYTPIAAETAGIQRSSGNSAQARRSGWPFEAVSERTIPNSLPDGRPWPKISIVTPSYNQGRFLEQTILSVINQRYPNIEHIIIDGGSTDETADVLKRYRTQLSHVASEPDRGQSHAINKGMAVATGEILTWLNSDDMLAPGALFGVALALATSGADLVAGVCTLVDNNKVVGHHLTCCEDGPLPLDDILDLDGGWNAGQFFYQPEVMFSREMWERAGGFVREDLYYSMDYDLWVRFAEAGARLHVIGRAVAWYRVHENQKTSATAKFKQELEEYRSAFLANKEHQPVYRQVPANPKTHLRIAMLNDLGYQYGAGIAHRRIAAALQLAGHNVTAIGLQVPGADANDKSLDLRRVVASIKKLSPDLIIIGNLHWTRTDPVLLHRLSEVAPTCWVLHDLWALTGRCAFTEGCDKYLAGCDDTCPTHEQYPPLAPELIEPAWRRKRQLLSAETAPVVLPYSSWAAEFARNAAAEDVSLSRLRIEEISLGLEMDRFVPLPKGGSRKALGLPDNCFLILVSGDWHDPRKGMKDVFAAVELLGLPDIGVVIIGNPPPKQELPVENVYSLGFVHEHERQIMLYSAVDLFVGPSREETFGQVFIEAPACGTPVVGFSGSGVADAVYPGVTGTLLEDHSVPALAAAIREYYLSPRLSEAMGAWGRLLVENRR
ncbi:MAG: glycosyltransferase, partial [bacterium]|nr:glycosyltransferase [bacterium]